MVVVGCALQAVVLRSWPKNAINIALRVAQSLCMQHNVFCSLHIIAFNPCVYMPLCYHLAEIILMLLVMYG